MTACSKELLALGEMEVLVLQVLVQAWYVAYEQVDILHQILVFPVF